MNHHPLYLITLLIMCLIPPTSPIQAQTSPDTTVSTRFFAGIRVNNALPYGALGLLYQHSKYFSVALASDLGGQQGASSATVLYTVTSGRRCKFSLGLGPNLDLIKTAVDSATAVLYLSSATSAFLTITINPQLYIHIGIAYLSPAHPPKPYKIFLGASFPLSI